MYLRLTERKMLEDLENDLTEQQASNGSSDDCHENGAASTIEMNMSKAREESYPLYDGQIMSNDIGTCSVSPEHKFGSRSMKMKYILNIVTEQIGD